MAEKNVAVRKTPDGDIVELKPSSGGRRLQTITAQSGLVLKRDSNKKRRRPD